MSKYDTAINSTNTVGVGCGLWSAVYSWLQSVDWVAVGSFIGMVVAYLINIYFNIQRRKEDKAKYKKEIEILENQAAEEIRIAEQKAQNEIKVIKDNNDRKLAIELEILQLQLEEEKRKNKQHEKERQHAQKELLNMAFKNTTD